MKYSARSSRGFTLVELMVTVAIVAILAAIAYPSYIDYIYRSRLEQARVVVMDNVKMMERYYGLSRSFECKADYIGKVNTTCTGNKFTAVLPSNADSNITDYYDFAMTSINKGNSYIITAKPKSEKYSSNTLANKKLFLNYDAISNSYARCTQSGFTQSEKNSATVTGCEVL